MSSLSFSSGQIQPFTLTYGGANPNRLLTLRRPDGPTFIEQAKRVESWAALRAERGSEILAQLGPPYAFWSSILHLNPEIVPYTQELIGVALEVATIVVQKIKYETAVPRPSDLSARIQPMVEVPGFFAWPSGHATQAFTVAELLAALIMPEPVVGNTSTQPWHEARQQLMRQAERIATNRVVAGLHYPADTEAGCALGMWLAHVVIHAGCGAPVVGDKHYAFNTSLAKHHDFSLSQELKNHSAYEVADASALASSKATSDKFPIQWLWAMARQEWHANGLKPIRLV